MPILKRAELGSIIGNNIAKQLTEDDGSFERAEQTASELINTITGLDIPADADDAPVWAKSAAGYIIQFNRIGVLTNLSPQKTQLVDKQYAAALASLERHKQTAATGRPAVAERGTIEGDAKW